MLVVTRRSRVEYAEAQQGPQLGLPFLTGNDRIQLVALPRPRSLGTGRRRVKLKLDGIHRNIGRSGDRYVGV